MKFLIKWEGFDETSWEPKGNIHPEVVATYMAKLPTPAPAPAKAAPAKAAPAPAAPANAAHTKAASAAPTKPGVISRDDGASTALRKYPRDLSAFTGIFVFNNETVDILETTNDFTLIRSGRNRGYVKSVHVKEL